MGFVKITPAELSAVSVTLQAVDNQWVPRDLLRRMLDKRLTLLDVAEERNRYVRTEFFRSLVNAEMAIFGHNTYINDAVVGAFLKPSHTDHENFRTLLANGAMVPFLYKARAPEIAKSDVPFSHDPHQRENWNRLCRETDGLKCLRLDWDDDSNTQKIQGRLSRPFHDRLKTLSSVDPMNFVKAFGLHEDAAVPLRRYLTNIDIDCANHFGNTGNHVTRDYIYNNYIVAGGTDTKDGKYDSSKPFIAEIKQTVDLIYTTNLADAIGRYPLTPVDSPGRSILQEMPSSERVTEATSDGIIHLLKSLEFDFIQRDLFLASYEALTLGDIIAIRGEGDGSAWHTYIECVKNVLGNSTAFNDPEGVAAIYRSYIDLARHAGELASKSHGDKLQAEWEPRVKLVLEVAGAAILEAFWPDKGNILYSVAETAINLLTAKTAPAVARLVVVGRNHLLGDSIADEVAASIVFWQGRVRHADELLEALAGKLGADAHFEKLKRDVKNDTTATLDQQE